MSELRLVGLNDDGDQIVLEGPDGQRFALPIDDALRAAVRRDRPQLEALRAHASALIPPREMQARIRAGATAQEVAEAAGVPVEIVERYEGPVLAERDWISGQARDTRIGHETSAPTLGDLVTDRLATRGVVPGTVRWDAARDATGPWTVTLAFEVGEVTRTARWAFDPAARTIHALDDEARWLSETELADEPVPRRHLAAVRLHQVDTDVEVAVRPVLAAVDAPTLEPEPDEEDDPFDATEALLEDLHGKRGVRQPLDEDDDEDFEGFGPQHAFDFEHPGLTTPPAAHPADSRPEEATDATVIALPSPPPVPDHDELQDADVRDAAGDAEDATDADGADADGTPAPAPTTRSRSRKGRASVPSWDEIVFGAKPE
ncbi:septation protein SepH [Actinotalea sp. M2MS4P-6]|uniref:septation protein SepH n=1 Tax=Actinotalea sp. M2MS4P-6 TaxID=2983762 RepID=UPI0021E4CC48|nr:septation protein SepH [Actinotalea sp. M2MS4P-6]MCV2396348.1 septation protein SepH [Actinotalea sp. M2MS4P-6]